ncbi:MAG: hypothetical protein P8Y60_02150, partial [Calditrichota bacterium]
ERKTSCYQKQGSLGITLFITMFGQERSGLSGAEVKKYEAPRSCTQICGETSLGRSDTGYVGKVSG